MASISAQQYLFDAGRHCPYCASDKCDNPSTVTTKVVDRVALIMRDCRCLVCRGEWVETYRLVGVASTWQEASATAERTYSPAVGREGGRNETQ